jgi:agmatine/peptidylarginine deiminase
VTSRLPAEWEPQSGIMLTWPHAKTDWAANLLQVESVFVDITRHISRFQSVVIACFDYEHKKHIADLLEQNNVNSNNCHLYLAASNDSWARDHGPITILNNGAFELLDFTFNGWGNKYPSDLDNQITSELYHANAFNNTVKRKKIDIVLEGGSIETDGRGTLLTTAPCLLSPQRNPGQGKNNIEDLLRKYLHVQRIIWLNHGCLQGDDTDGHIDTLARFADPETILYVASNDPDDINYQPLSLMEMEIKSLRQIDKKPYRLVRLPSITLRNSEGQYLPASYANFLILNKAVLVPVYDLDSDSQVLEIFNDCFVDRKIFGINCRELIQQNGSLHCVTMHFPQGVVT